MAPIARRSERAATSTAVTAYLRQSLPHEPAGVAAMMARSALADPLARRGARLPAAATTSPCSIPRAREARRACAAELAAVRVRHGRAPDRRPRHAVAMPRTGPVRARSRWLRPHGGVGRHRLSRGHADRPARLWRLADAGAASPFPTIPARSASRSSGEQWWWRVSYPQIGRPPVATANEIRIPAGRPVLFTLSSADVIHSFWVPNLGGKVDMIPGRTTHPAPARRRTPAFSAASAPSTAAARTRSWRLRSSPCRPPSSTRGCRARRCRPPSRPRTAAQRGRELFLGGRLRRLPHGSRHAGGGNRRPRPHASGLAPLGRHRYRRDDARPTSRASSATASTSSPAISCRRSASSRPPTSMRSPATSPA